MDAVKLRNRVLIRFLARSLSFGIRCLYATCRIRVIETVPKITPYAPVAGHPKIYCVWHDGIMNSLFCGRTVEMAALTSRHADGEYVAEIMEAVGIRPIRGSNKHGGAAAARQMLDALKETHVTVATDGPRGPRRVVKPGIVYLASQTGHPIIPVGCSATRAWRPRGKWTELLVPKPFSTAVVVGGLPLTVPPDLSREQLSPFCRELQRRMDDAQEQADSLANNPKALRQAMAKAA
jgi:lysophospholipid acyltransferase (LPLAT)-like uncharacterized protein